jgi:hypothetical protein
LQKHHSRLAGEPPSERLNRTVRYLESAADFCEALPPEDPSLVRLVQLAIKLVDADAARASMHGSRLLANARGVRHRPVA